MGTVVNELAMAIAEKVDVVPTEINILSICAGIIHEEENLDILWDYYVKKHGYTKISRTHSGLKSPTTIKRRIKTVTDRILNYDLYNIENRDIRLKHTLCICNIPYTDDQDDVIDEVYNQTITNIRTSGLGEAFMFWSDYEIKNAIISLSDEHQRVIILKYYYGKSDETIAASVYGYMSSRAASLVASHITDAENALRKWKGKQIDKLMIEISAFQTRNLK